MNKYILCAMDKSKTEEELKKNADAAAAADAGYAASAAAYDAYDAAYAASDAYAAAHASAAAYAAASAAAYDASAYAGYDAAAAYDAYGDNMEYWLGRYFEITGENREDYEKAIKELEK